MAQSSTIVPLQGGLDLVTPAMLVQPGRAAGSQNYAAEARGYRRMDGYERFDGRLKPSAAVYAILDFTGGSLEPSVGDTVAGATSGATGILIAEPVVDSGSWAGGDATGHLVISDASGTFQAAETLTFNASDGATADGAAIPQSAESTALHNTYLLAAQELLRDRIAEPPGSGPTRGGAVYGGEVYVWRDNSGGTAGRMWKATSSGWTAVSFGHTLDFTAGTAQFPEGVTIVGVTSGATGKVQRVVRRSGAWSGDAAGYLVLSNVTGTFQSGENINAGGGGSATASGAQASVTLPAGGHYRTTIHNFYGGATARLYAVNGVGRAIEFDGTVLAPIDTGLSMALDKPTHVAVRKNHLVLAYPGGTINHSGVGLPLSFSAIDGAGSIEFGTGIMGLGETATALVIIGDKRIGYLVGDDATNFTIETITDEAGGFENTFQIVGGRPIYLDHLGLRELRAAESFGNFRMGSLTQAIEPLIAAKRGSGLTAAASLTVRARDQYRLFWNDGTGLFVYLGRRDPEILEFSLPFAPAWAVSGDDELGRDIMLAGDANSGMVYQLDIGTSFDGDEVEAFIRLHFINLGSPQQEKRWHRARVEIDTAASEMQIAVASDYGYGDPDLTASPEQAFSITGSGGIWDISNWDEFQWSAPVVGTLVAEMNGIGTNVALTFISNHTVEAPHTLSTLILNHSPRRTLR